MKALAIAFAMLFAALATPVLAAKPTATPATFAAVWAQARDGDTILLQPGNYPDLILKGRQFATGVTITSADPAHMATLSDANIINVSNLAFRQVEFITTGLKTFAMHAQKSQSLSFDHVFVHGSLDNDASNDGSGLFFHNTSNVVVTNSEFTQLRQALGDGGDVMLVDGQKVMGTPSNATVTGNKIYGVMKTGMIFASVSNVTVAGNTISDIRVVPPEHPDAIQFFTTGSTAPAHDIVIRDNLIFRGGGAAAQGIFLRDQTGQFPYQHVVIADNLVVGTGYGGIYVIGAKDLQITGNELVSDPGRENQTFLLVQKADEVRAESNKAVEISFDGVTNLTQTHNVVTSSVRDKGAAALATWATRHPAP